MDRMGIMARYQPLDDELAPLEKHMEEDGSTYVWDAEARSLYLSVCLLFLWMLGGTKNALPGPIGLLGGVMVNPSRSGCLPLIPLMMDPEPDQ